MIVYRKGDIVKQPTKKGSFVPKNVPGVGGVGWGWVIQGWGWGGSCRGGVGWGGVGHTGVGWVMQWWGGSCRGGVGHTRVGWGGSCRGGVGHAVVGWVM